MDVAAMIELYDRQRLLPRRDPAPGLAAMLLLAGLAWMGSEGWQQSQMLAQLKTTQRALQMQEQRLGQVERSAAPTAALLADLRRQAEALEAETLPQGVTPSTIHLTPSGWLEALSQASLPDVALDKVELSRDGTAVLSGHARSAGAITAYVQAWQAHPVLGLLATHALKVRESGDEVGASVQFELRVVPRPGLASQAAQAPSSAEPKSVDTLRGQP
jgi:Tfp pilus assembly protein PilN